MLPPLRRLAPPAAGRRRAALNFLIAHSGLIVCALFLLAGLDLAGDYGVSPDEANQRQIAIGNRDYILGRADRIVANYYQDRVSGAAFELPLLLAEQALGLEDYYYIHRLRLTLTHLFFIVGGFFCYLLACRLFNNRLIALFALLIYLLHPRIYAHSFFNSKDPVFLSMFSIALYLLERAFRKNTPGAFILLGVAVGLLTNLRIMGVMLFPAVIALRGLDWFQAGGGPERKGILVTGGLFLLSALLTVYALSPYAWTNPLDYWAASLDLTVNYPVVLPQLFQGEVFPSDQAPPHFTAVWFAITMPPLLLLLGGLGAAAAVARGFRRPWGLFRNNDRRFQLLLLALFLLPPLAAALLGSNRYQDWRHFYFLYAPFCLLAAGGLHWLAAALTRRRLWRIGAYGMTGLGLGLTLLQLTQLHPMQYIYFNFLVDRTTPEYLRTQYDLDYWVLAPRAALADLLERYPQETLTLRVDNRAALNTLPPADRERLLIPGGGRRADYELIYQLEPSRPDLAFNSAYRRLYNSAIAALRPLQAERMTPAAVAAYQEIYRQAVAGEPIIRADYNVYRNGSRLTFVKENCPPESRDAWFSVRPYPPPPGPAALPPGSALPAYGNGNHGVRLGDICLAVLQLSPAIRGDVVIAQSNLGKFRPVGLVWQEFYSLDPPGLREYIGQWRQEQPPAAPHAFAVFLDQDAASGYRLLYAKANCAPAEYEASTFLHIIPESRADLPFYLWQSGVDNREFPISRYGVRSGGECMAVVPLPDYPIAAILTGQTGVWETNLYPPADPERLRADYAALSDSQPAARAIFDLYFQEGRLVYLRESCVAADTAAGFFLHIIPGDIADLPGDRQDAGFANLDFAFARYGGSFDGRCMAAVPLPNYPIKTIRTGQYVPGQGELWAAELAAGQ